MSPLLTCWKTCAVVSFVTFGPWLPSVCKASQTSAAMMISGKSALRKKRFTWLSQRVPGGSPSGDSGDPGLFLRQQRRVEHAYIGQIPVALGEIEAVTDHEAVR